MSYGSRGQLSIGGLGAWGRTQPHTRLVLTGMGNEQAGLLDAFEGALLTWEEWDAGLAPCLGERDVLAPWLGDRHLT